MGAAVLPRRAATSRSIRREANGALRRAELLLAAGGDPRRGLELVGRAVTSVARRPRHAASGASSSPPGSRRSQAEPGDTGGAGRGAAAASAPTPTSPGTASRRRCSPRSSAPTATTPDPQAGTPAARTMRTSPLTVRARSSISGPRLQLGCVVHRQLRRHRPAHGGRVDPQPQPGANTDAHVAGDGLELDLARLDGADLLVPRHGGDRERSLRIADHDVAGREVERERSLREPDAHVARRGLDVALAAHLVDARHLRWRWSP